MIPFQELFDYTYNESLSIYYCEKCDEDEYGRGLYYIMGEDENGTTAVYFIIIQADGSYDSQVAFRQINDPYNFVADLIELKLLNGWNTPK